MKEITLQQFKTFAQAKLDETMQQILEAMQYVGPQQPKTKKAKKKIHTTAIIHSKFK
jgi:hypothetical protein